MSDLFKKEKQLTQPQDKLVAESGISQLLMLFKY